VLWLDLVLEHGVAYGKEGRALEGKKVLSAITSGGRRDTYGSEKGVRFSIRQLLVPFEQTVNLCRMDYLPPFLTHGTHLLTEDQIKTAAEDYAGLIKECFYGVIGFSLFSGLVPAGNYRLEEEFLVGSHSGSIHPDIGLGGSFAGNIGVGNFFCMSHGIKQTT